MNDFLSQASALASLGSRKIIGKALEKVAKTAPGLTVLYADVGKRFNLDGFKQLGGRCLDVGIAEQNMIGVAAGICHEGGIAVAISYAPFIVGRAFDQIRASIGEMQLPLILIGAPSGLSSGGLGSLSTCVDDMAMLRTIPGLAIVSPADGVETVKCLVAAVQSHGPIYIRMTGGGLLPMIYHEDYDFAIGRAVLLRKGRRVLVVTAGAVTSQVLTAANRLESEGYPISVLNMHTVKPLDTECLDRYLDAEAFVTVEEHSIYGGLGGAVSEYLSEKGVHPVLVRLGTPDRYFVANHYDEQLNEARLSAEQIHETLLEILHREHPVKEGA